MSRLIKGEVMVYFDGNYRLRLQGDQLQCRGKWQKDWQDVGERNSFGDQQNYIVANCTLPWEFEVVAPNHSGALSQIVVLLTDILGVQREILARLQQTPHLVTTTDRPESGGSANPDPSPLEATDASAGGPAERKNE